MNISFVQPTPVRAFLKGVPPSLLGRIFVMGTLTSELLDLLHHSLRTCASAERKVNPDGWKEALQSYYQLFIVVGKRLFMTPIPAAKVEALQVRKKLHLADAVFAAANDLDDYHEDPQ